MKILVNAARQGRAMGGSQRYESAFLTALQHVLAGGDSVILSPKPSRMHRLQWELVEVNKIVRREQADVILSLHNFGPLRPAVPHVLYARNPRHVHPAFRHRPSIRRWFAHRAMRAANRIIVPSATMASWLLDAFLDLESASKVRIVHHGVDHTAFFPTRLPRYGEGFEETTAPIVFAVGPRDPWRSLDTLEAACQDLPVQLMIANGMPQDEIPAVYRLADIFAFPSGVESFGLPMVEAMASGLPIVAADTEINREILGDAALYFPPHDWVTLRVQLKRLMQDATLRKTLGDRGYERSQRFSWERTAQEVLEILKEAVSCSNVSSRS